MSERKIIDGRGSFCPGPLMEMIAVLKQSQIGDELEVLSNDKGSAKDIPEWAHKVGHQHVSTSEDAGVWHITVRKMK